MMGGARFFKWVREHGLLSFFIGVVIFLLIAFFGTKLFFYFRFIIGNDVIVELDSDKKDLFLKNGQDAEVEFLIKGIAEPFCKISCEYKLKDISRNNLIENENFDATLNEKFVKKFKIKAEGNKTAQDIYQFSVKCHNNKRLFCQTNEENVTRHILITVNRELNEQQFERKNELKENIEQNVKTLFELNKSLNTLNRNIEILNGTVNIEKFIEKLNESSFEVEKFWPDVNKLKEAWEVQEFAELGEDAIDFERNISFVFNKTIELNESIQNTLFVYNEMISDLSDFKAILENLSQERFNQNDLTEVESIIKNFNTKINLFKEEKNLSQKNQYVDEILVINLTRYVNRTYGDEPIFTINETIFFDLDRLAFVQLFFNNVSFELDEPIRECCAFGKCRSCCENCENENYPIVFLHGHDFSEDISPKRSVNIFDKMQGQLEKEGYITVGEIYSSFRRSDSGGILGRSNNKLTYRASYYFDVFKQTEGYVPVQTKSESIETYAIRLLDLINEIKFETGKDKVIIMAHSMGGLVARRYIQIFGNESVDKLILVDVPNHGITGRVKTYCSILGASLECRDMDENSLFINKLNNNPTEKVNTLNIIGRGCQMDGGDGDGVVLVKKAVLENAEKVYYVNGSCSGTLLLHNEILNIDTYPEVYNITNKILNSKDF